MFLAVYLRRVVRVLAWIRRGSRCGAMSSAEGGQQRNSACPNSLSEFEPCYLANTLRPPSPSPGPSSPVNQAVATLPPPYSNRCANLNRLLRQEVPIESTPRCKTGHEPLRPIGPTATWAPWPMGKSMGKAMGSE